MDESGGGFSSLLALMRDEVQHHSARLIGMGLFWTWLQVVFAPFIHEPGTVLGGAAPAMQQAVWPLSLTCTCLVFCASIVLSRHRPMSCLRRDGRVRQIPLVAVAHASMSVGTALLIVAPRFGTAAPTGIVCATVLTGMGSGVAFLAWGRHLSRLSGRRVLFDMAVYAVLTALLTWLASLLPHMASGLCATVLPLMSGWLLASSCREDPLDETDGSMAVRAVPPHGRFHIGNLAILAIFVGLVFGLMREIALPSAANATLATVVGIAVSAALLLITVLAYKRANELYLVCQISFPLLSLGFLLLHFMENRTLPIVIFMAGHNYFYSLLWTFCAEQARDDVKAPGRPVFAVGLLAFLGSSLAGSVLAKVLNSAGVQLGQEIGVISLVVLYLFILTLAYLFGGTRRGAEEELSKRAQAFKLATQCVAREGGLSPREEEVFHLVALGKDRAEICQILGIAVNTVKVHTRSIYAKLGIHSKKDAIDLVERHLDKD